MKARDLMSSQDVQFCRESDTVQKAAQVMCAADIGSLPVVNNDNRLLGIITDRDICCRVTASGLQLQTTIAQVMSKTIYSVSPDASVEDIEETMREHKVRRVPVIDQKGRLQGIISISDLAHHCIGSLDEHELVTVFDEVTTPE
jgi:CBS domain-containing protein